VIHHLCVVILIGGFSYAANPDSWVPVRWPGGPLGAARRTRNPEAAAVLKNWYQLSSLDLLRETPINCLLVTWSAPGVLAVIRNQQHIVAGYASEARKRGFVVLGLISGKADAAQAAGAAFHFELDGLVLEGDFMDRARLAESVRDLRRKTGREFALISLPAAAPPGIRVLSDAGAATASPSSEPWIDSNLWLVRSLRAASAAPAWLGFALDHPSAEDYTRAIAESAAGGGRWAVAPDDALIAGLARKSPDALATWRRIAGSLKFFEQHAAWRGFAAAGPLGIVVDPHSTAASENLNLITRRRIPYRVILRSQLNAQTLEGLRMVLATELTPPTAKEAALLKSFAEQGGLVVTGPAWGVAVPPGQPYLAQVAGKGQIIVYRDSSPNPDALSKDLLSLLGKPNLGVRLFNAPTILPQATASEDRSQLLVQLINYANGPAESITVRVSGPYRYAQLYSLDGAASDLPAESSEQGTEVTIQKMDVYAALLLER
jgi:hypothetical protein